MKIIIVLAHTQNSCFEFVTVYILQYFGLVQTEKSLQKTILNLMIMVESSPNGQKTLLEEEKLLVTSNFSFSHCVFRRLVLQTCKNQGLFWKGLKN